jgi:hypothetical protein
MAQFFVYKNGVEDGPFGIEDLEIMSIYETTLVWKIGEENWKEAARFEELENIIQYSPPKIPEEKIGYDRVEDIAKIDYKKAAIFSVIYLLANVFISEFMYTSKLGLILNGGIPFVIWWYFKRFFINLNDRSTAKFVNWIFAGYAIFVPLLMYTLFNGWDERLGRSIGEFLVNIIIGTFQDDYNASTAELDSLIFVSKFVIYSFILITIFLWIAGIKLLRADKRYNFPLKRIAFSTMFFIPVHMFFLLGHAVINKVPDSTFMQIIAMIPYALLGVHFYRADSEDATP